jgi:hypothetical protein
VWAELEIEPTIDERTIRRAYIARLKAIADDDPRAFIRLREAYEGALRGARAVGIESDSDPPSTSTTNEWCSEPLLEKRSEAPKSQVNNEHGGNTRGASREWRNDPNGVEPVPIGSFEDFEQDFKKAMGSGRTLGALSLLDSALAKGIVPLGREQFLIAPLLECSLNDQTLSGSDVQNLVDRFALDAATQPNSAMTELADRCRGRADAHAWFTRLLGDADRWAVGGARQSAISARILLHRIGEWWLHGVDESVMRVRISEYRKYATWTSDRLDSAWITRVEKRLSGYSGRRLLRKEWRTQVFWALFWLGWIIAILNGLIFPSPPH